VQVVLRFEAGAEFLSEASDVLALLATRPGFLGGQVARAYDEPERWCLLTEWESVGAYRRALGSYEVKVGATGLLSRAVPEASAYETLVTADADGQMARRDSDRWIPSRP
jgi:heme-degrading monooxygenase HmoA